ncbi:hypothetical protein NEMBOFW57_007125 [Staphylotrichum longicolle]|uniref:Uncharacterized protein n=1 Tax=Staphylotrichum longicolle TaxID=669026 RepID=A0AAD4I071_9PEZI|nr:hypothetical protein NEMBOFW57_007125 [Staphylotrichum longicolle]
MTCVSLLLLSGAEVNPAGADVNTPLCRLIVAPDFRRFIGLETGAAPSQETARWMIHLLLEDNPGKTHDDTQEALNFIKGLPDEWRRAVFRDPFCLALALQHGWPDLAQESWGFGLELGQFSEKLRAAYFIDHFWADDDDDLAELGEVCLDAAVRNEATSILEGLLELGVKAIPPQALLYLIDDVDNLGILKSLVEHGGKVHIRDNETDGDGTFQQHPHWLEMEGCINAMKLAILRRDHSAIRTMLKYSPEPVDPWFRYFYLKEAYTLLEPATVACLLEHPSMRFDEADITHEADLPLAHLVRNVGKICSRPGNPAVEYGPQARMDAVKIWIDCIAAFSQAGVDPTMRDRAGKSALDYLEEHLAYVGKDRFKNHLALALRLDGGLDPEHELGLAGCFYEVLKSIEIMQDTTE